MTLKKNDQTNKLGWSSTRGGCNIVNQVVYNEDGHLKSYVYYELKSQDSNGSLLHIGYCHVVSSRLGIHVVI